MQLGRTPPHIKLLDKPRRLVDAHGLADFKLDAPPKSTDKQPRKDVPSSHVPRLAERLAIRPGSTQGMPEHADRCVLRLAANAAEKDLDSIRPLPKPSGDVKFMGNEHVRRFANVVSIQEDVRQGIDAIKPQNGPLTFSQLGFDERPRVQPLIPFIRPVRPNIESLLRLRQEPGPHEVEFAVPGNRRTDRPEGNIQR